MELGLHSQTEESGRHGFNVGRPPGSLGRALGCFLAGGRSHEAKVDGSNEAREVVVVFSFIVDVGNQLLGANHLNLCNKPDTICA